MNRLGDTVALGTSPGPARGAIGSDRNMVVRRVARLWLGLALIPAGQAPAAGRPNVIVIVTDDQGYGDLSCHGHPVLRTPNLDRLHAGSVRFTDFHVAPMCSPTRGQLLTGRDAMRNGATAVTQGRTMIRNEIRIMPQFFAAAGYATGMFGKWHLGDSHPHRPQDRGFAETLWFHAWGIPSLAEHWNNGYFDPWLIRNGERKRFPGYCTDILFDEAMAWMARCQAEGTPFFVYLPTNVPHGPDIAPAAAAAPYRGRHDGVEMPSGFYGMIANFDENLGRLETFLAERKLGDDTILVFLTDNGTAPLKASRIFNAGMRDRKRSLYEGGHRVPLFVRWPQGGLAHGRDVHELTQVQDLLPTLVELCGLEAAATDAFDGVSLVPLLTGERETLPDRMCVVQYGVKCKPWETAAVMWGRWRLVGNDALYDLASDPHQDRNVFAANPDVARRMAAHYDAWYAASKPLFDRTPCIRIGSERANPETLYADDWHGNACDNEEHLTAATATGTWSVIVDRDGTYEVECRRWPASSGKTLTEPRDPATPDASARPIAKARLKIGAVDQTLDIEPHSRCARFTAHLPAGETELTATFLNERGEVLCGAFYTTVTRK